MVVEFYVFVMFVSVHLIQKLLIRPAFLEKIATISAKQRHPVVTQVNSHIILSWL